MNPQLTYKSSEIPGLEALSCRSGFSFGEHLHNGHVLWVNSGGGERFQIKGHSDILQPGCISIIEPGVVHSNGPLPASSRHLRSIYLGEAFFRYLDKLFTGYDNQLPNLPSAVINNKLRWQQTIRLHELIMNGADQMLVEEQLIPLFDGILAEFPCAASPRNEAAGNSRPSLNLIVEFMRTRLQDNLSLEMLAALAGCTSFHLMRLFRKHHGMSPHTYLVQLRLERAKELLGQGQSIADAAFSCGFSDQSHLTRRFKQRYGITPGAYLRQHTN